MWENLQVIPFNNWQLITETKQLETPTWVPKTRHDFSLLRKMKKQDLLNIGMRIWDNRNQKSLYLFPKEWYPNIPEGITVYDIFDKREKFSKKTHGNDERFGVLSYGLLI